MKRMGGWMLAATGAACLAQQGLPKMPAGTTRRMGVDAGSGIAYALLSIEGEAMVRRRWPLLQG